MVSIKITGEEVGVVLKPVLRDANLALSFCLGSKHIVVSQINTMMKRRRGLNRNKVLRPTPGDRRGVEQHHWNTRAKENQQLNPGRPSNRQKKAPAPTN